MMEGSREALRLPHSNDRRILPSFWQELVAIWKQECLHPSAALLGFSIGSNENI